MDEEEEVENEDELNTRAPYGLSNRNKVGHEDVDGDVDEEDEREKGGEEHPSHQVVRITRNAAKCQTYYFMNYIYIFFNLYLNRSNVCV